MDPLLGEIALFSFNFAPAYWMECAGQTLSINNNQALFSLLGTKFGGDGTTTFCLPDLRGAALFTNTSKYYIATQGIYPSRS
jgi:microcystin-dependent protein